ncbi:hypothetical protein [Streptomyces decoyicus]|uniref:hypothetical protein n=1 Tax=Streptomyces decoyicus TaxID=249567 RepID=UPI0037F67DA0
MLELIAACTPNSHPHDGEVLVAINLPNWESSQEVTARPPLPRRRGLRPQPDLDSSGSAGWSPAGLGFLVPVVRTGTTVPSAARPPLTSDSL